LKVTNLYFDITNSEHLNNHEFLYQIIKNITTCLTNERKENLKIDFIEFNQYRNKIINKIINKIDVKFFKFLYAKKIVNYVYKKTINKYENNLLIHMGLNLHLEGLLLRKFFFKNSDNVVTVIFDKKDYKYDKVNNEFFLYLSKSKSKEKDCYLIDKYNYSIFLKNDLKKNTERQKLIKIFLKKVLEFTN